MDFSISRSKTIKSKPKKSDLDTVPRKSSASKDDSGVKKAGVFLKRGDGKKYDPRQAIKREKEKRKQRLQLEEEVRQELEEEM